MAGTDRSLMLVESITIDAPIGAVFAALTQPDQLVAWWGSDDGYRTTAMEADVRAGGAWKTSGVGKNGPFTVGGVYRVVEPPEHLEFTWRYSWGNGDTARDDDTIVRYDLAERAGATTLTVTHTNFADRADRDDHARGWPIVLGWLEAFLYA